MRRVMTICVALMLGACASTADTAQSTDEPVVRTAANAVAEDDLLVCRNVTKAGSRFTKKECRPQWQWDFMENDAQAELERRRRATAGTGSGNWSTF